MNLQEIEIDEKYATKKIIIARGINLSRLTKIDF